MGVSSKGNAMARSTESGSISPKTSLRQSPSTSVLYISIFYLQVSKAKLCNFDLGIPTVEPAYKDVL
jgi:hypothetical protein